MVRTAARANWQLRVQRKLGADYLKGQSSRRRKAAIVAAVAAVHAGLVLGFLTLQAEIAAQPLLVHVRILPAGKALLGDRKD